MFFFFFKQKTAYEIMPSLVGSEMCIRDRFSAARPLCGCVLLTSYRQTVLSIVRNPALQFVLVFLKICLLYTSDAADEEDSVDLGGRRIIKKKKKKRKN